VAVVVDLAVVAVVDLAVHAAAVDSAAHVVADSAVLKDLPLALVVLRGRPLDLAEANGLRSVVVTWGRDNLANVHLAVIVRAQCHHDPVPVPA